MSLVRLRTVAALLAAGLGLSACSHYDGYGHGRVSVGYSSGGYCDPYWDDCYYGRSYDPWYGWYGGYYYPGIGIYIYDRDGRRHRWNDRHRRHWEGRRGHWRDRDWNDRRWERWGDFRSDRREWREDRREVRDNRRDFRRDRRDDRRDFRQDRREDRRELRRGDSTRDEFRQERRQDRREFSQERRRDRRELRRENRRDRRD